MGLAFKYAKYALVFGATVAAGSALAEMAGDNPFGQSQSVLDRPRPLYDPPGLHIGAFTLYPSLTGGALFTDNVFNSAINEQDDTIFELSPRAKLVSNWSRHELQIVAESHSYFYSENDSEDRTDWSIDGRARIDVTRSANFVLHTNIAQQHEARGAPELPGNAAEPTEYMTTQFDGTFNQAFNRFNVSAGVSWINFDYDNVALLPPAPPPGILFNDDRDRDVTGEFIRAGYEFSPGYSAFVRAVWNQRDFDLPFDRFGFIRDSDGFEIEGGLSFLVTNVIVGEAFIGWMEQRYDDPAFSDVDGTAFGAEIEWYPTMMTTVRLDARHSIEDTTVIGASGYQHDYFAVNVDHELLRNLIVTLGGSLTNNGYDGVSREDDILGALARVAYLMNRNLQFDASYTYEDRDSNVLGQDYTTNTFRLALTGKL